MTRKRIDATTDKPVDFYARGRTHFDALDCPHVTQVPTMTPAPDIYAQFAATVWAGVDMAKPGTDRTVGMSPLLAADYARAQAADAPAELRDWFWEAVRRGCSDE